MCVIFAANIRGEIPMRAYGCVGAIEFGDELAMILGSWVNFTGLLFP
jgi:hypothetical protein